MARKTSIVIVMIGTLEIKMKINISIPPPCVTDTYKDFTLQIYISFTEDFLKSK